MVRGSVRANSSALGKVFGFFPGPGTLAWKADRFLRRSVGRAAAAQGVQRRRPARVVAPMAKPARAAHAGGWFEEAVRENGFGERVRGGSGAGGRKAGSRSRDGLSRGARRCGRPRRRPAAGTAAPPNGASAPGRGAADKPRRRVLRGGATQGEPSGDLCGAIRRPGAPSRAIRAAGRRHPPRAPGSSGNGRSRRGGIVRCGGLPLPGTEAGASRPTAWTQRRQGVSPPDM